MKLIARLICKLLRLNASKNAANAGVAFAFASQYHLHQTMSDKIWRSDQFKSPKKLRKEKISLWKINDIIKILGKIVLWDSEQN